MVSHATKDKTGGNLFWIQKAPECVKIMAGHKHSPTVKHMYKLAVTMINNMKQIKFSTFSKKPDCVGEKTIK
jgi:hypothetical protein